MHYLFRQHLRKWRLIDTFALSITHWHTFNLNSTSMISQHDQENLARERERCWDLVACCKLPTVDCRLSGSGDFVFYNRIRAIGVLLILLSVFYFRIPRLTHRVFYLFCTSGCYFSSFFALYSLSWCDHQNSINFSTLWYIPNADTFSHRNNLFIRANICTTLHQLLFTSPVWRTHDKRFGSFQEKKT